MQVSAHLCKRNTARIETNETGYLQRVSGFSVESKEGWEWGIWDK